MQFPQPNDDSLSFGAGGSKHDVDEGHGAHQSTTEVGSVAAVLFQNFANFRVGQLERGGDEGCGYHYVAAVEEGVELFEGRVFVSPYWFDGSDIFPLAKKERCEVEDDHETCNTEYE